MNELLATQLAVRVFSVTPPMVIHSPVGTRVRLGKIPIDTSSLDGLLRRVIQHALGGNRTQQIVTANAQFYVLAEKDKRFRACLAKAEFCCADGMPIVWACQHLIGTQLPRIADIDLIEDLCRLGASYGLHDADVAGPSDFTTSSPSVSEPRILACVWIARLALMMSGIELFLPPEIAPSPSASGESAWI